MINQVPAILLILGGCSIVVLVLTTAVEILRRPRKRLALLVLIRAVALGLLCYLIANYWQYSVSEKELDRQVIILRDVSTSMKMLSGKLRERNDNYLGQIRRQLGSRDGVLQHDYVFAAALSKTDGLGPDTPSPSATALGDAVLEINRLYPGGRIVLLSDGCDNLGIPAREASRRLRAYGTRIYPIGLAARGDDTAFDVAVEQVYTAPKWTSGNRGHFRCGIQLSSPEGVVVKLKLEIDGDAVMEKEASLEPGFNSVEFELPRTHEVEIGWHEYQIISVPRNRELTALNNTGKGIFYVKDRSQVTLIWDHFNPDLRYLYPVLKREYGGVKLIFARKFTEMSAAQQQAVIKGSGLLILGKVNANIFSGETLKELREALRAREIALLFVHPGALPSWCQTEFGDLLPVREPGKRFGTSVPWMVKLKNEDRELALPVHTGYVVVPDRLEAIKERAYRSRSNRSMPLILNKGRVTCLTPIATWRWCIGQSKEARLGYRMFWQDVFRRYDFLQKNKLQLFVQEQEPAFGQLDQHVYLFSTNDWTDGGTAENTTIELLRFKAEDQKRIRNLKRVSENAYQGSVTEKVPGVHWFRACKKVDGKTIVESNRVPILIPFDNRELRYLHDGGPTLQYLAKATGGDVLSPDDPDQLQRFLEEEPGKITMKSLDDKQYFAEIIMVLAVVLLMGGEWFLRQTEKAYG